ncbi:hypothetical protein [Streptomyces sp. NPDC001948]
MGSKRATVVGPLRTTVARLGTIGLFFIPFIPAACSRWLPDALPTLSRT